MGGEAEKELESLVHALEPTSSNRHVRATEDFEIGELVERFRRSGQQVHLTDAAGSFASDPALQSWILSFGPFARVIAPVSLAHDIAAQFEQARAQYGGLNTEG